MTKKKFKDTSIKVDSIVDAEKIIYEKIKQGINTRDIVKTEFDINGISKKFNPYQIKKIKEKFETPESDNRNVDKAILFELFYKGVRVIDAVIQTKFDPKFVNQVWEEYLEIKGICTIPKYMHDKLFQFGETMLGRCKTYGDALKAFEHVADMSKELDRFYVPCRVCEVPMFLDENMITKTTQWMQNKWVCSKKCRQEEEG